jgi:hypothetical protein
MTSTAIVKDVAINTLSALNAQLIYRSANGEIMVNTNIVDKITGLFSTPVVIDIYQESKSEVVPDATE